MMAVSYGYIYVAQIAIGADMNQAIKAITEAEAYPGPSLIIAYSPCINHGLRTGMGWSMEEQKQAVACGYWSTWRYNPALLDDIGVLTEEVQKITGLGAMDKESFPVGTLI